MLRFLTQQDKALPINFARRSFRLSMQINSYSLATQLTHSLQEAMRSIGLDEMRSFAKTSKTKCENFWNDQHENKGP